VQRRASLQIEVPKVKHYIISEATILSAAGAAGMAALSLDLSDNCLKRTGGLAPLTQLTALCLAFNEILSLLGLSALRTLAQLDVSHNHVSSLRGLENLSALTRLDASHNALAAPEDINLLRRCGCLASGILPRCSASAMPRSPPQQLPPPLTWTPASEGLCAVGQPHRLPSAQRARGSAAAGREAERRHTTRAPLRADSTRAWWSSTCACAR
jgi:hypothetical protein